MTPELDGKEPVVRFDETKQEGVEIDMTAKELSSAPAQLAYSEPEHGRA